MKKSASSSAKSKPASRSSLPPQAAKVSSSTKSSKLKTSIKKTPITPPKKASSKISKKSRPAKKTVSPLKKEKNERQTSRSSNVFKVLMVASECAPYAKSGGLADAVSGLSKVLHQAGHEVRILIPLYRSIDRAKYQIEFKQSACIHMGGGEENWVGLFEGKLEGKVPVWFLDYARFFDRPGIYDHQQQEYSDNPYRFGLLCKAALQFCKDTGFIPDVIHTHDWPSALVPAFLKTWDRIHSPLSQTASVLTIHNIGYQGKFHPGAWSYWGMGSEHFHPDIFEDYGAVNLLKGGIFFADALTTVSPTHAKEIIDPIGGMGLAPYISRRFEDLKGILNGVDSDHWNPETDSLIAQKFSRHDFRGKLTCKIDLQIQFGLEVRPDIPVFGVVSRFAHQKGLHLLQEIIEPALQSMVMQIVFLGNGEASVEDFIHDLTARYPGKVGSYIGFCNQRAHQIEAGSDFFLMPSLYEPCGLNQIYSLKYGTLPLVRATGGLDDTVIAYDEATGNGTGFKFHEVSSRALLHTMGLAVATWYDRPHHIAQMRQQAMQQHFTWEDVLPQYIDLYRHALQRRQTWV